MINIVIVGCGEFGSRHLQALSYLQESSNVFLVDRSEQSLTVAIDRFNSVYNKKLQSLVKVVGVKSIDEIQENIDLVIVATSSKDRLLTLSNVLSVISPKYIILEKFLFQESQDFVDAKLLIDASSTEVFVNQWLSSNYLFSRIRSWLGEFNKLKMTVSGGNWGISCNSIHFVDYFETLIGKSIDTASGMLNRVYAAKREGFYEFNGSIVLNSGTNFNLELISEDTHEVDVNILIETEDKTVSASIKPNQQVFVNFKDFQQDVDEIGSIPFQSKITNVLVEELMIFGYSRLPTYEKASRQHMLLLPIFNKYIRENSSWNGQGCPIT